MALPPPPGSPDHDLRLLAGRDADAAVRRMRAVREAGAATGRGAAVRPGMTVEAWIARRRAREGVRVALHRELELPVRPMTQAEATQRPRLFQITSSAPTIVAALRCDPKRQT